MLSKLYHIEHSKTRANCVDLDEVAHYEPPHLDLRCLQIQLFPSLVLKELTCNIHINILANAASALAFAGNSATAELELYMSIVMTVKIWDTFI